MFGKKRPNNFVNYGYSGQIMHQYPIGYQWNQQYANRNQPFPYQPQSKNNNWPAYQQQNPYYPQYPAYGQHIQQVFGPQNMQVPQSYTQKDSQFLFQNPLAPQEEMGPKQPYMPMNGYPMMNPYPKQNVLPKQPGGVQSIMNSFKSQDGSVDINKMVNTAGQMMNAMTQVSSLVKGFGGMFKV